MKKILVILVLCLLTLTGCLDTPKSSEDNRIPSRPTGIKVKSEENSYASHVEYEYVEVDGHIYLVIFSGYRGGITHSGTCPCNPNHDYKYTDQ